MYNSIVLRQDIYTPTIHITQTSTDTVWRHSRSGNVDKEGCYYNVADLRNEALANQ